MGSIVDAIERFLSVPKEDQPEYVIDALPRFEADESDHISDIDPVKEAEPPQLPSVQEQLAEIVRNTRNEVDKPSIAYSSFLLPAGQLTLEMGFTEPVNRLIGFTIPIIGASSDQQQYSLWIRRPYDFLLTTGQTSITGAVTTGAQRIPSSFTYPEIAELPYPATRFELWLKSAFAEDVTIILEGFYKK